MIFLELFYTFFIIGAFTIGGGYAMLPLIQDQVVNTHAWISAREFTDIIAISQMTPGPIGINSATYIGYTVLSNSGASQFLCVLGSFTATAAVVLPSFLIVLGMCFALKKFSESTIYKGIMDGLKPTVAGLIGAAAVMLINTENFPDWKSWLLFGTAFLVHYFTKINVILIIIAAGIIGYFIY